MEPPVPLGTPADTSLLGWLAWNDGFGDAVFSGLIYSDPILQFLKRYLRPGMTVLDVGAHHGLYTLLMSKLVGSEGTVLAFEPSPREFRRLCLHLRLNRCSNVVPEQLAISDRDGVVDFFVVLGYWSVQNSLRPPTGWRFQKVMVRSTTLDTYLAATGIESVDLIKLDVQGAELEALRGSTTFLSGSHRPVVICELSDHIIKQNGWSHSGQDIVAFLHGLNFEWFAIREDGRLYRCPAKRQYDEDLVAIPEEQTIEIMRS